MASSILYSLFRLSIVLTIFGSPLHIAATTSTAPNAFILPIKRDDATRQYITTLQVGIGSSPINVCVHVGGESLWFNNDAGYNSSSYEYIPCSEECPQNDLNIFCRICIPISNAIPPCSGGSSCGIDDYNPFIMGYGSYANQRSIINSLLSKDVLLINSTDVRKRGRRIQVPVSIPNFKLSYVRSRDIKALASGARGVLGLGNTPSSLPVQLSSIFNISNQFSICLPSSSTTTGTIFIGAGSKTASRRDSLMTTPLVPKFVDSNLWPDDIPPSEYYIGVKSINIDGQNVPFDSSLLSFNNFEGFGGTTISTALPYTVLHSDIFNPLCKVFEERAAAIKIKKVDSIAPFGACFDSKTIIKSISGEFLVPAIDLVLEGSNSTYWRIHGRNSMVKVNNDVMCLAFVNGGTFFSNTEYGTSLRTSIIIGACQLENNYLEFDLESSLLRFSSSLLAQGLCCSRLRGHYL